MAAGDARPIPQKNVAYRLTFDLRNGANELVSSAGGLDSEVSGDGGAFTDCTNEATEIGSTGVYTLDLTAAEMNDDTVVVKVTSSTAGVIDFVAVLYPEEAGDIRVNLTQWAGVAPNALSSGRVDSSVGAMAASVITAAAIAADAITAAKIATGAIDADAIAADAITAAKIAADAIGSSEFATTAANKIRDTIINDATAFSGASIATILANTAAQAIRDAMKLAPTAGAPAAGSVDGHLDEIEADTSALDARVPADPADASDVAAQIAAAESNVRGADSRDLSELAGAGWVAGTDTLEQISAAISAITGISQQDVRDAMKLAPTAGAPAAGSVDQHLDDIESDTNATLQAVVAGTFAAAVGSTSTEVRTNATEADGFWDGMTIVVIDSGGEAIARRVQAYANTNGAFTVDALPFTPAASDVVLLINENNAVAFDAGALDQAFDGFVWFDAVNGTAGTAFPLGTRGNPVDNLADADTIAAAQSIQKCMALSNFTLSGALSQIVQIYGEDDHSATVQCTISSPGSQVELFDMRVSGTMDASGFFATSTRRCTLFGTIDNFSGSHRDVRLRLATLNPTGTFMNLQMVNVRSDAGSRLNLRDPGAGVTLNTFVIDRLVGQLTVGEMSDNESLTVLGDFYQLTLDSSVNGSSNSVVLQGVGQLVDNSTALATLDISALINDQTIRDGMKLAPTAGSPAAGSVDQHLDDLIAGQSTLAASIAALNDVSAADVVTALLNQVLPGHASQAINNSVGQQLRRAYLTLAGPKRIRDTGTQWLEEIFEETGATVEYSHVLRGLAGTLISSTNNPFQAPQNSDAAFMQRDL